MWTRFWDNYSEGYLKVEPYQFILINNEYTLANKEFEAKFQISPNKKSCECCKSKVWGMADYTITEFQTLEDAIGFLRGAYTVRRKKDCPKDTPVVALKRYWERKEEPPIGYKLEPTVFSAKYQTVQAFLNRNDVLILDSVGGVMQYVEYKQADQVAE